MRDRKDARAIELSELDHKKRNQGSPQLGLQKESLTWEDIADCFFPLFHQTKNIQSSFTKERPWGPENGMASAACPPIVNRDRDMIVLVLVL